MRKSNHLSSKSAACFLVAMVAFVNASCSTTVSHGNSLVIPAAVAISNKNASPLTIGVLPTRVIWESAPILPSLIVVSKKISKDSIKKIKTSFLNIPEGIKNIFGGQSAGYTFIDDYDYTPIHELPAKLNLKSGYIK